ncbi:hypothetical protein [Catenulispora sp. EB89]|uniref:hypothetical protein n=1 Tax=Catenulispora sp. EB89 TaxID=3156257 RepID=UPI0035139B79
MTDWSRLHHAYGPATDVPGQLAALTSEDPAVRETAVSALMGSVSHQGTRWPASAYVVEPLMRLVDNATTPDRTTVLDLLHAVAIGDRLEDGVPFDRVREFAAGDQVGSAQTDAVIRVLFQNAGDVDDIADVGDAVAVRWAADAYRATERHLAVALGWLQDPDSAIAARAAALVAWFPQNPALADALAAVTIDTCDARASANLAAAHLPGPVSVQERSVLITSLRSAEETVRVTAAVALAYRESATLPDEALSVLASCEGRDTVGSVPGWKRSLKGHVALALRRIGF